MGLGTAFQGISNRIRKSFPQTGGGVGLGGGTSAMIGRGATQARSLPSMTPEARLRRLLSGLPDFGDFGGGGLGGGIGGGNSLPVRNAPAPGQVTAPGAPSGQLGQPSQQLGQQFGGSLRNPIIDRGPSSSPEVSIAGAQPIASTSSTLPPGVQEGLSGLNQQFGSSFGGSPTPTFSPQQSQQAQQALDFAFPRFSQGQRFFGGGGGQQPSAPQQAFDFFSGLSGFTPGFGTPESAEFRRRRQQEISQLGLSNELAQEQLQDQFSRGLAGLGIESDFLGLQGRQLALNERQASESLNDIARLLGLSAEEFAIRRGETERQAATQERGLRSDATARGATVAEETRAGLGDIESQLAASLGLLDVGEQKERMGLQEQRRSAEDEREMNRIRKDELNLRSKELGLKGEELKANLEEGLQRSNLDTFFSVNDLLDSITQSRGEDRILAERIFQQVLDHSSFFQNPQAPGQVTAPGTPTSNPETPSSPSAPLDQFHPLFPHGNPRSSVTRSTNPFHPLFPNRGTR